MEYAEYFKKLLGLKIKQVRLEYDMTQKEMAKYLGISTVSYQRKESGIKNFYFWEVKKICTKANVSLDLVKI